MFAASAAVAIQIPPIVKVRSRYTRTVWLFYHTWAPCASVALRGERGSDRFGLRIRLWFLRVGLKVQSGRNSGVEGVTGFEGGALAHYGTADQRQVAHQVHDLVPDEFVAEAQLAANHAVIIENDAVIDRAASSQSGRAQHVHVAGEAECTRGGNL